MTKHAKVPHFQVSLNRNLQIAALSLLAAMTSAKAAQEGSAVEEARNRLMFADGAAYVLSVPAEEKKVNVQVTSSGSQEKVEFWKDSEGRWQAGLGVAHNLLPMVLKSAFSDNNDGPVRLQVTVWSRGKTNTWEFSSSGVAEGVYALRCLAPERKWAEQTANKVPTTKFVAPLTPDRHRDVLTIAKETGLDDPELKSIVFEAFNAHRAEILARFGRGRLYYPRAEALGWSFRQTGPEFYALSGCNDRSYSATFVVRLDRKGAVWAFRQIYAYEWYKGD